MAYLKPDRGRNPFAKPPIEVCPDCGRELDTESQYYDYCHIIPGGGWLDVCFPPPTTEELEKFRKDFKPLLDELNEKLKKTLEEVIKDADLCL